MAFWKNFGWNRARKAFDEMPPEPEAFIFEIASAIGTSIMRVPLLGPILRSLGHAVGAILIALSPAMPFDVREHNSFSENPKAFYLRITGYAFPITVFFCYVLNAILTLKSGTFLANAEPDRLSFFTDGYNGFLFAFICPAYVSAALCLVITVGISWKKLSNYSDAAASASTSSGLSFRNDTRLALFISISILIAGIFIAQFGADLANPRLTEKIYWFFDRTNSGERVLNLAGVYYLVMNAILLFITSMAAFCYISMSIELFRLGKYIKTSAFALQIMEPVDEARRKLKNNERLLRTSLSDFSYCYVLAKILVFLYAINIWVWQISRAGNVANVHSAIAAIILVGMFVLVIPRLYLGSKWHRLKIEYAGFLQPIQEPLDDDEEYEYHDVRSKEIQKIALVLDIMFALALAFILYQQYGKTGVLDIILERVGCLLGNNHSVCPK